MIEDYFEKLNDVYLNQKKLTDNELALQLKNIYYDVPPHIFIHHHKTEKLIKKRVRKYCKKNKIKLSEYDGVLPYRIYLNP